MYSYETGELCTITTRDIIAVILSFEGEQFELKDTVLSKIGRNKLEDDRVASPLTLMKEHTTHPLLWIEISLNVRPLAKCTSLSLHWLRVWNHNRKERMGCMPFAS
eukprot:c22194_g1_i4 orf=1067-1384(+)